MKIEGINNLDVGISNIEIEGKVTYEKTPRLVEGDNEKGHYKFYSQFVVIDDGTGKIGCNVTFKNEEHKLQNGDVAKIKGKIDEYQGKKQIKGKLIGISKGKQETDVQLENAKEFFDDKAKEEKAAPTKKSNDYQSKDNYWKDKLEWEKYTWKYNRAGMSRSNGVNFAVNMVNVLLTHKVIKPKKDVIMDNFWNLASTFGKYIFDGKDKQKEVIKEATKEEKIALAHNIVKNRGKLELREGQTALLEDEPDDSPITEEELNEMEGKPGSSPQNAIAWNKGKK